MLFSKSKNIAIAKCFDFKDIHEYKLVSNITNFRKEVQNNIFSPVIFWLKYIIHTFKNSFRPEKNWDPGSRGTFLKNTKMRNI